MSHKAKLNEGKDGLDVTCGACSHQANVPLSEVAGMGEGEALSFTPKTTPAATTEDEPGAVAASSVIQLSAVTRGADGRIERTKLRGKSISFDVQEALEGETLALSAVQTAIAAGKIKPADRPKYERIALSNLSMFRDIESTLTVTVDMKERGHGQEREPIGESGDLTQVNEEVQRLILSARTADKTLSYSSALKQVGRANPALIQRQIHLTTGGKK